MNYVERKDQNQTESLRSPRAGSVHRGDRGNSEADRRARGGTDSAADGEEQVDGAAFARTSTRNRASSLRSERTSV